ncbi:uncharacterized protein G2W53_017534 [Senna tora]|uniref:Uncharacterized protein n=1 Tax=Senna tora TaxID=362788 RepID=A0A834WKA2_9FABA|nr:uncharacterized protein G2W53_017534 [Senna tora]
MPPPKFCGISRRKGIIGHQLDQMKLMVVVDRPDESWKAMHETSTLNSTIGNLVAPLAIRNYAKLVDRCRIVASNLEGADKDKQKVNFSNKRPINFSNGGNSKDKKPMLGKVTQDPC